MPKENRYSSEAINRNRILNYNRWVHNSINKYSDNFDYSIAIKEYKTQKNPDVTITCKLHNNRFKIAPDQHFNQKYGGCIDCKRRAIIEQRLVKAKAKFYAWFKENRADRLEIISDFSGMTKPLKMRCKVHNTEEEFLPERLMYGAGFGWGCSLCALASPARRLDPQVLFDELNKDLPEGISINIHNTDQRSTKIIVDCKHHGKQPPIGKSQFLSSTLKCKTCSNESTGFADYRLRNLIERNLIGKPCSLAVMEIEVYDIRALKVGITTRSLEKRYREALKKVLYEVRLPERDALVLENRIKLKFSLEKDTRIKFKGMRLGKRWSGDTELFLFKCHKNIINYIKNFLSELKETQIDYELELGQFVIPTPEPRSSTFIGGKFQGPISIIGLDPNTNEILYSLNSMKEAEDLGFSNISTIVSDKYGRALSGGIRWFKFDEFDPNNIPPLEIPNAKAVFCVERNQHFRSTVDAEEKMRTLGYSVSASKVTSAIKGHRPHAGGFTWKLSNLTTQEILNQLPENFIDYKPSRNPNSKKPVSLTAVEDRSEVKEYESCSAAARALETSAGNIKKAIDRNRPVKGYIPSYIK